MSEVVELDDFKEDLKMINDKLDILTKQLEKEQELKNKNRFTPEKVMADRDLQRIFMTNGKDVSLFLTQWQTMTKEDKQEFIARYIESLTFEKDDRYPNGIHLIDIKLKSLFTEKVSRLSELGLSQVPVEFISNDKSVMLNELLIYFMPAIKILQEQKTAQTTAYNRITTIILDFQSIFLVLQSVSRGTLI